MTSRVITVAKRLRALVVEAIRRLWDHGYLHNNKIVDMIYQAWLPDWIDVKTANTMASVDEQAKALTPEPEVVAPLYWEQEEGETPLGGAFGYRYIFVDDAPSGADPLQGPE